MTNVDIIAIIFGGFIIGAIIFGIYMSMGMLFQSHPVIYGIIGLILGLFAMGVFIYDEVKKVLDDNKKTND